MHNNNDFTIDQEKYRTLPEFVKEVHEAGMHYVLILDPGVSASEPKGKYPPYDEGVTEDIFIKNQDDTIFIGKVWNFNSTAFPDFTNPKVRKYWTKHLKELHNKILFDGLWIVSTQPVLKVLFYMSTGISL